MTYVPHPQLTTPSDDTVLWRYMDFARFLNLLESCQLYFSRADQFDDPLEGTITDGEWLGTPLAVHSHHPGKNAIHSHPLMQVIRHASYVSCWRMGLHESLAMWDLYGKGSGIVAVTTTIGLLKEQLSTDHRPVFLAEVKYVDWNSAGAIPGMMPLVARKEMSYAHEAEMRAFVWDNNALQDERYLRPEELPRGLTFDIDLQHLLSAIWIGPREKLWIRPLVEKVVARYGLDVPIRASDRLMPRSFRTP